MFYSPVYNIFLIFDKVSLKWVFLPSACSTPPIFSFELESRHSEYSSC